MAAGLPSSLGIRPRFFWLLFKSASFDKALSVSGINNRYCAIRTSPCVELVGACEERVVDATDSLTTIPRVRLTPTETDDPTRKAERPLEDTRQKHPPTTSLPNPGDKEEHPPRTLFLFLVLSLRHLHRDLLPPRPYADSLLKTSRQSNVETDGSELFVCGWVCGCACVCVEVCLKFVSPTHSAECW